MTDEMELSIHENNIYIYISLYNYIQQNKYELKQREKFQYIYRSGCVSKGVEEYKNTKIYIGSGGAGKTNHVSAKPCDVYVICIAEIRLDMFLKLRNLLTV